MRPLGGSPRSYLPDSSPGEEFDRAGPATAAYGRAVKVARKQ
ncbi:hypothetical protein ACFRMN_16280 [Streptomyces sp. NPDC056835]